MSENRVYRDALGEVQVAQDKLWRSTTQRSYENFGIKTCLIPQVLIKALAQIKASYALAHAHYGLLTEEKAKAIVEACDKIIQGELNEHFPLSVFQTGSATQSNMNVNEVIAEWVLREKNIVLHPNDDINKGQSSNDVVPAALHMAFYEAIDQELLPSLRELITSFEGLVQRAGKKIKVGRTHLQDAVPMFVADECSAFAYALEKNYQSIEQRSQDLLELALGGTAVGTGLNASPKAVEQMYLFLAKRSNYKYVASPNLFYSLSLKDVVLGVHNELKVLATTLFKIGNDIRLLASGPDCSLGELFLPANEPGSSIMPGKVNPTQIEALCMVVAQVLGHDTSLTFAASQGHLQLNTYMPLMADLSLKSVHYLSQSMKDFAHLCVEGIAFNDEKYQENLDKSLMLVTALNKKIGYDKASQCVKYATKEKCSLVEAVAKLCEVDEETVRTWINLEKIAAGITD